VTGRRKSPSEFHGRSHGIEVWGLRRFAAVKCFSTPVCCRDRTLYPPPKKTWICTNPMTHNGRARVGTARGTWPPLPTPGYATGCRKETARCRSCSFQFKVRRQHSLQVHSLRLARLQSSKHTGAKQNLTQNGHSRSLKVTCFGVSGKWAAASTSIGVTSGDVGSGVADCDPHNIWNRRENCGSFVDATSSEPYQIWPKLVFSIL